MAHRLLSTCRQWLIGLLLLPALAGAAPLYQTIGNIGTGQGGLTLTDLGNGTTRWSTVITWTNNNAFATNDLYFVLLMQWVQGSPVDANAMQWDNGSGTFKKGGLTADADNEAFYVPLTDTDIDVSGLSVFDVDAGDSMPAFLIGSLGVGASVSTHVDFIMTSSVDTMWFNGAIVEQQEQQVPEPATLALFGFGLAGLGFARRKQ